MLYWDISAELKADSKFGKRTKDYWEIPSRRLLLFRTKA